MTRATGVCSKCDNPLTGKHQSYCRKCYAEYTKAKRDANREVYNAYQRQYTQANPEKRLAWKRNWTLKVQYGLSMEDVNRLLTEQDQRCAICHREITYGGQKFDAAVIDHDHSSGKVRGLLCGHCNRAVGLFGDNVEVLRSAISYLSKENL